MEDGSPSNPGNVAPRSASALPEIQLLQSRLEQIFAGLDHDRSADSPATAGLCGYAWTVHACRSAEGAALIVPGMWSLTPFVLEASFAEVVVWDPLPYRAEVLRQLCREQRSRMRVLCGPLAELPRWLDATERRYALIAFEQSYADWPATRGEKLDLLERVARSLERDGQCAIVNENRWSIDRLRAGWNRPPGRPEGAGTTRGREDSILAATQRNLPTVPGLRRILRRTSLPVQSVYHLYPDHVRTQEILGGTEILPRRLRGRWLRIPAATGLVAHVHNAFLILAAPTPVRGTLTRLVSSVQQASPSPTVSPVDRCTIRDTGVVMVKIRIDSERSGFLRVALDAAVDRRLRRAVTIVDSLRTALPWTRALVPRSEVTGELNGVPFYVEAEGEGEPAALLVDDETSRRSVTQQATGFLLRLHRDTREPRRVDDAFIDELVGGDLSAIEAYAPRLSDALRQVRAHLEQELTGRVMPMVWAHGDFNPTNVLCDPRDGTIRCVIDWDSGDRPALPLLDLLHFVLSVRRLRARVDIGEILARNLGQRWPSAAEDEAITDYCAGLGIDGPPLDAFLVLYWIRLVAQRLHAGRGLDPRLHERLLTHPLDAIVRVTQ